MKRNFFLRNKEEPIRAAFLRKPEKRRRRFLANINSQKLSSIKKITVLLALLAIIGFGIYSFFFSSFFTIKKTVIIQDGVSIENAEMNSRLSAFRGQRIFFLNKGTTVTELLSTHPDIEKASIETKIPSTLLLNIKTYPRAANIINISKEGTKKVIVNTNGLAIALDQGDASLPNIQIETEKLPKINTFIINKDHLAFMVKSQTLFDEFFDIKLKGIIYKKIEREAHLETEKSFLIWMDLEKDPEKQLLKLKTALPKLNINSEPLKYIDLRISGISGEKIFYR